jgi:hypothetical protein
MVYRGIPQIAAGGAAAGGVEAIPFPAPTKGLNLRDHFTQLDPAEAMALENWLPDVGSCSVRPGYEAFCTLTAGVSTPTLARYVSGSTAKLLAATNGHVYDVTSGTAVDKASGYSQNLWSTDYANGYLFAVNGTDTPWRYDGSTVGATGFTGVTLTTLRTVRYVSNAASSHLWFTDGTADVWYGGSMAVTGALTKFQLSQIADGGYCMAVLPWRDATCFCMSTGQVLIYQGDVSTTFALYSKYYAPPLVEPGAAVRMGGEVILLTTAGPISMDVIASGLAFNLEALGNWAKIAPGWQTDYASYGSNAGKFINGLVYLNVATGSPVNKQYVFNTRNEAWTVYTNLPLASLEQFQGNIYFGSTDGFVRQFAGPSDNGNPIITLAQPGFSYIGSQARAKMVTALKPNIFTSGTLTGQFQIDADFVAQPITSQSVNMSAVSTSGAWDLAWDLAWGDTPTNNPQWISRSGFGRAVRPVTRTSSIASSVQWFSTDILAQSAGVLS